MGRRVLVAFIALVVSLAAAETALRWYRPITPAALPLALHTHDRQRVARADGYLKLVYSPYTVYQTLPRHQGFGFTVNSRGLRGPELRERSPDRRRLVLVGGSAAWGWTVADADTITAAIERSDPSWEAVNGAVVGYHSGQELLHVVTDLVDLAPDVIVAYDGWNDLFDPVYLEARGPRELGYNRMFYEIELQLLKNAATATAVRPALEGLWSALVERSALVSSLRASGLDLGGLRVTSAAQQGFGVFKADEAHFAAVVRTYVANLVKLAAFCRRRGVRFLAVIQPELGQKRVRSDVENASLRDFRFLGIEGYARDFPPLYARFAAEAQRGLAAAGVEVLDVNEVAAFRDSSQTLFLDPVHTSPAGNQVIAPLLLQRLSAGGGRWYR